MNYAQYLQIPQGKTVSGWTQEWLHEIMPDLRSIIKDDNPAAIRERNERFSAYLSTFSIVLATYREKIAQETAQYAQANPPPDSGIRAWEKQLDAHLAQYQGPFDFIQDMYNACSKRLSASQTHLRSKSGEVSGLG